MTPLIACPHCAGIGTLEATDIFCGAGGSSLGLELVCCPICNRSLIKVTQALNHWDLAVQAHNANFPDADHDVHDVEVIATSRFKRTDILWASPECFEAGTLVLTDVGLKPIEHVSAGDMVLTHKNRWRRVARTQSKPGAVGTLKGQGHPGLRVTANHGIWGRKSKRRYNADVKNSRRAFEPAEWIDSSCMRLSDSYWASPTEIPVTKRPRFAPAPAFFFGQDLSTNLRWWWIVGRYLGDGFLGTDEKHCREVGICCGKHETEQLADDLGAGWTLAHKRTADIFTRSDVELHDFLEEHFGTGSAKKTIPTWVMADLPTEYRQAVLDGYVSADGHIGPKRTELTTVSKGLAIGARLLTQSLGLTPSVYLVEQHATSIEGRDIQVKPIWRVTWDNHGSAQEAFVDADDTFLWSPTRQWSNDLDETTVYNLEVEEDHSYVADGIVVKNCTHHAYCRGPKDFSDAAFRSRATFADIIRFTRDHRYDAVIVENVVEARLWCDELGHREKCSCGETFNAWFKAICDLGYEGQIVYFNSQFAMVPQSRDRMYVVFWRKGVRKPVLDFRPVSWCSTCETVVRGIQAWKTPSKKGLRTQEGLYEWGRYGQQYLYRCPTCTDAVAPAVSGAKTIIDWTIAMQRIGDRARPLAPNTRKRIRVGIENIGRRVPVQVQVGGNLFERQGYARVWSVDDPLRTVTGTRYMGLVVPGKNGSVPASTEEPAPTVTSRVHAAIVRVGGQAPAPSVADEPMGTITAHDRQRALVVQNMEHNSPRAIAEPAPPVTTGGNHMLVQVTHDGPRQPRDLSEPMPTIAGHGDCGIVSLRNHDAGRSIEEPTTAVTGGGFHHGLLVYNGVPGFVRELEDAAGTVTGRDKQSLLVPYYTTGKAHDVATPLDTVSTKDREALVVTEADIDDCLFRMLQWPELLRAQTMSRMPSGADYQLTARRRNKRGNFVELSNELRTRMIGNAVSSYVAAMLGSSVVEALR